MFNNLFFIEAIGENNEEYITTELTTEDENDINGDDAEHALMYKGVIFFSTHRESVHEIDPSYK